MLKATEQGHPQVGVLGAPGPGSRGTVSRGAAEACLRPRPGAGSERSRRRQGGRREDGGGSEPPGQGSEHAQGLRGPREPRHKARGLALVRTESYSWCPGPSLSRRAEENQTGLRDSRAPTWDLPRPWGVHHVGWDPSSAGATVSDRPLVPHHCPVDGKTGDAPPASMVICEFPQELPGLLPVLVSPAPRGHVGVGGPSPWLLPAAHGDPAVSHGVYPACLPPGSSRSKSRSGSTSPSDSRCKRSIKMLPSHTPRESAETSRNTASVVPFRSWL